jgi:hypothetical protein
MAGTIEVAGREVRAAQPVVDAEDEPVPAEHRRRQGLGRLRRVGGLARAAALDLLERARLQQQRHDEAHRGRDAHDDRAALVDAGGAHHAEGDDGGGARGDEHEREQRERERGAAKDAARHDGDDYRRPDRDVLMPGVEVQL